MIFSFCPSSLEDISEGKRRMHCDIGGHTVAHEDALTAPRPTIHQIKINQNTKCSNLIRYKCTVASTHGRSMFWTLPQHALNNLLPVMLIRNPEIIINEKELKHIIKPLEYSILVKKKKQSH